MRRIHRQLKTGGLLTQAAWLLAVAVTGSGHALADSRAEPEARADKRLSGILISSTRRLAMIDGETVGQGDRIGDVRVLAIERRSILIRSAQGARMVSIGAHFDAYPGAAAKSGNTVLEPNSGVGLRHRVAEGDTLSEIALAGKPQGLSLESAINALYALNPHAFAGSPDALRSGVVLNLPGDPASWQTPSARAYAASDGNSPELENVDAIQHMPGMRDGVGYVDVLSGDTLSDIAMRLGPSDASREQRMLALYQSNPKAFGGNINLLYAGARLIVPGADEIREIRQADAAAEITRQHADWQSANTGPALLAFHQP